MKTNLSDIKKYVLLYCAFLIYSGTSICAKLASQQSTWIMMIVFMGMEVCILGVYALIWQQVLKKFTLVTAMANKGIVVVFNLIWSVVLFHEVISIYNIVGAAIIIWGIWMVSSDA